MTMERTHVSSEMSWYSGCAYCEVKNTSDSVGDCMTILKTERNKELLLN